MTTKPQIHPDPAVNAEIIADVYAGLLEECRAVLGAALDLNLASPAGQRFKNDVRNVLAHTDPARVLASLNDHPNVG